MKTSDLTWDTTVQAYAQNYANQRAGDCNLVHSDTDAVKKGVDEEAYYDYNSNSCASGQQCGHYSQVAWGNSVRLGCAKVTHSAGGTFIGCNYDPPGNVVGEKPY
ncbi:PREDICTED: pathogenesis-related protein 1B-like [Populus euphratica]|uniref:Pathogenesis-related protein 1B-like n=1 Tax=Populus euphratica TaxID=75702 RepID=A0AAJ6XF15_POPEU|nr:PREDICTED: pathogenesis-related protein 1B-like [Populus euphratica]